jgi:hypothetical protein
MFLAGSMCASTLVRSGEHAARFRTQKIFLDAENNFQVKLADISHSGCHAAILIPGSRDVSPVEVERIAVEACRFDLKILVPTCLSCDLLGKTGTILPLSHEAGVFQHINGKPTDDGGFLLLDKNNEPHGLVLYDSSRCRWSGFAAPRDGFRKNIEESESGSRLMIARWLDQVLSDHSRYLQCNRICKSPISPKNH